MCSAACPVVYSADQADLELSDLPASAYSVLGLKACDTTNSNFVLLWVLLVFVLLVLFLCCCFLILV